MKTYLYSGLSLLSDGQSRFLDGAGLDEHLQTDTSTSSVSHLSDHLGSTSQLLDSTNGSAKARYDYKSYGRLEGDIENPVASNAYTYTGREDDGTGLMYYRARYYDPELEIFISQDPLGDAQRYVGGNPLGFVDPLGLDGVGVIAGGSVEGGSLPLGLGGHLDAGAGVFSHNGSVLKGTGTLNAGAFSSGGAFAGGIFGSISNPVTNTMKFVGGAYAGVGAGIFYTNAGSADDLRGPFDTFSINTPIASFQYGRSGNINIFSLTGGPGAFASISRYSTNTGWASPIFIISKQKHTPRSSGINPCGRR